MKKLTKEQAIVLSAYTGILMCDFTDLHNYLEKILERPVWVHELANAEIIDLIREKSKDDFFKLL